MSRKKQRKVRKEFLQKERRLNYSLTVAESELDNAMS
jgi:hypothetical protein